MREKAIQQHVYDIPEVCEVLKVSAHSIYRYIRNGELKAMKIGRGWRITEDALASFMKAREK